MPVSDEVEVNVLGEPPGSESVGNGCWAWSALPPPLCEVEVEVVGGKAR